MGLADLWETSDWKNFWWLNWQGHQNIIRAIAKQRAVNLTLYHTHDWVDENAESLLEAHQHFHDDMNQVLGITGGKDFSTLDFKDPEAVQKWTLFHWNEHAAAHAALKI